MVTNRQYATLFSVALGKLVNAMSLVVAVVRFIVSVNGVATAQLVASFETWKFSVTALVAAAGVNEARIPNPRSLCTGTAVELTVYVVAADSGLVVVMVPPVVG